MEKLIFKFHQRESVQKKFYFSLKVYSTSEANSNYLYCRVSCPGSRQYTENASLEIWIIFIGEIKQAPSNF